MDILDMIEDSKSGTQTNGAPSQAPKNPTIFAKTTPNNKGKKPKTVAPVHG